VPGLSPLVDPVPDRLAIKLRNVRVLVCDVDGTLTDGTVVFGSDGTESRAFHIQDGLGIVAASAVGLATVWISGRDSPVVRRRAEELNVTRFLQGIRDKGAALRTLCDELELAQEAIAFIGDDINDLPGMRAAGVSFCPKDAASDVSCCVDWVLERSGGRGAVREAIELILRSQGIWETARERYLEKITGVPVTRDRSQPIQ